MGSSITQTGERALMVVLVTIALMARPSGLRITPSLSIAGVVVDAIGQPVPGATVTAIPEAGGPVHGTVSGSDGSYRLEALPNGTYRVDFDLLGFDVTRRNHVRVSAGAVARTDATLAVSPVCECITLVEPEPLQERPGQVLDQAGRPLPHARLEVVSPMRREVAYADGEGRFRVHAPVSGTWPIAVSDTGFRAITRQVSGSAETPIELKLAHAATAGIPDSERFARGCRCPGDLFSHAGR